MNIEGPDSILAKNIHMEKIASLLIYHPFCQLEERCSSIIAAGSFRWKQHPILPLIIATSLVFLTIKNKWIKQALTNIYHNVEIHIPESTQIVKKYLYHIVVITIECKKI